MYRTTLVATARPWVLWRRMADARSAALAVVSIAPLQHRPCYGADDVEDCEEQHNPYLHSDTESSGSDHDGNGTCSLPLTTHIVTFKCLQQATRVEQDKQVITRKQNSTSENPSRA